MTFRHSAVYTSSQQRLLEQLLVVRLQSWSVAWFDSEAQLTDVLFNQQLFGSLPVPAATKRWLNSELSCFAVANFAENFVKKLSGYSGEMTNDDLELVVKPYISDVLADLAKRLETLPEVRSEQVGAQLRLKISGFELVLQLHTTLLQRLARSLFPTPMRAPIALTDALATEVMYCSVKLKSVSMRMQQLSDLKRGSIVQLTQRVDQPLPFYALEKAVLSGHLVARDHLKAFYITSGIEERK
jgi:hypothetical protein